MVNNSTARPAIIALIGAFVALITALIAIVVVDVLVQRIVLNDLRNALARSVAVTAALIDGDQFLRFTHPNQEQSEEYRSASRPLTVLLQSNPDVRFAYTGVTTGARMHFVLDGSPLQMQDGSGNAEHAHPMQEDRATPGEIEVTKTRLVTVESRPTTTQWGVGIRAHAPIFNRAGEMVGYVGVTMRADRYQYLVHRTDFAAVVGAAIAAALAFVIGLGTWNTQRARARAESERRVSQQQLAAERDQLRAYARALDRAEDHARRDTATDLHDGIGQVLAGQSMILQAAKLRTNDPPLRDLIEQAGAASREALAGVQHMIQDLSPPELERATATQMLAWLAQLFQTRYGFKVVWDVAGEDDIPRTALTLMYKVVRESLYNAYRHSRSGRAEVEITVRPPSLEIHVVDAGVGFKTDAKLKGGFGLTRIRERVHSAGGTFELKSHPGSGCRVIVAIPV